MNMTENRISNAAAGLAKCFAAYAEKPQPVRPVIRADYYASREVGEDRNGGYYWFSDREVFALLVAAGFLNTTPGTVRTAMQRAGYFGEYASPGMFLLRYIGPA